MSCGHACRTLAYQIRRTHMDMSSGAEFTADGGLVSAYLYVLPRPRHPSHLDAWWGPCAVLRWLYLVHSCPQLA